MGILKIPTPHGGGLLPEQIAAERSSLENRRGQCRWFCTNEGNSFPRFLKYQMNGLRRIRFLLV